ncbi:energy-coupling factor ABC transporter ATP-binding protein [Thermococcus sp. 21S9]|uniref:energy-coupling factor ABC transporter ATP-binding protein n=1 Tax=Thermococcus sp. 21S9 TaxID=1638223 RepID=UPI00143C2CA0|nr:ATP-binding cassette domain-containing protein [Thermococcus sp. 21S9]NJE55207.1 ATP-binding cassette domain-containing protein [Thermococcus sp. 21S9]
MIELRDVTFRYPRSKNPALRDVDLKIGDGEFVGILGPSGSGKSTLALTLNGIIPNSIRGAFSGEVIVRDPRTGKTFKTTETPVSKLSTLVGLVLQNPESQLFNMTVEDEVAFALENLGLPREEIAERVEWALKVVGLEGLENEFPPNLSGGEKQRLAIASVIAMKPSHLVLDEPTSQLDPKGKREVLRVIEELHRAGTTVVMVEHDSRFLFRKADRLVVLNDGRVVLQGKPCEVAERVDELVELGVRVPHSLLLSRALGLPPALSPQEFPVSAVRKG